MLSNVHTAEDIAQEVFARVFEKRKDYDPQKRFSTWLWRIAVNRCYDELRERHLIRDAHRHFDADTFPLGITVRHPDRSERPGCAGGAGAHFFSA